MNEHEQNLRDLAAMFAMAGLLSRGKGFLTNGELTSIPTNALKLANEYMDARESADEEHGIVALKRPRKVKDV
jgi:hypothetical protein